MLRIEYIDPFTLQHKIVDLRSDTSALNFLHEKLRGHYHESVKTEDGYIFLNSQQEVVGGFVSAGKVPLSLEK